MTIDDFIMELQRISPNKRKKQLVVFAPNGLEFRPKVKMKMLNDDMFSGVVEKMVITHD